MARTDSLENFLTDVASSLRNKTTTQGPIKASNFDTIIDNIEVGSDIQLERKTVTVTHTNQSIKPSDGFVGLTEVVINGVSDSVDSDIKPENIRKDVSILGVVGSLTEGITPIGTMDITSNGVYNVTTYENVNVDIASGGSEPVTKGFIVNQWSSDGFATDITIVGVTSIPKHYLTGYYADALTAKLQTVDCRDATEIIENAVYDNNTLVTIKIPKVTTIATNAFYSNDKLTNIEWSDVLTSIGGWAFSSCKALIIPPLPKYLTTLGDRAFASCTSTANTHLDIPQTCSTIGEYCFNGMTSLKRVDIRGPITTLPKYTFGGCKVLTTVVLHGITQVPTLGSDVFTNTPIKTSSNSGYVYVPDELVEACKADTSFTAQVASAYIKPLSELPE